MTPERMNQVIHEQIRGLCWHEPVVDYVTQKVCQHWKCSKCGITNLTAGLSNGVLKAYQGKVANTYTTDLNAVALAEAKVIDGDLNKSIALSSSIAFVLSGKDMTAFATANQRAEALLRLMGLWEADDEQR